MTVPQEYASHGVQAVPVAIPDLSIQPTHTPPAELLFQLDHVSFGRFLETTPPARRWIVDDFLPTNIVGALAGMGGAGKSSLIFQLGISTATGSPFLGMSVGEPGGFLYLSAEDDEDELHRRGLAFLRYCDRARGAELDRELLRSRLFVVPRVGEDNLLTRAGPAGEVSHTLLVDRLIQSAQAIPDLRVIVVDPISRFRGGQANAEEDATRFVEALERIRSETGATVLGTAHVNKAGIKEGGGQEIVRGASALVDGFRWTATLQRLRRDQAPKYGLHGDEAHRYLRLELPKANYVAPFPSMWLYMEDGGVLVPTELEDATPPPKGERDYFVIVPRLQALLKREGGLTKTALRNYSTLDGPLQAGDKTVREVVSRALRAGDIVENRDGLLLPPGGEDH